MPTKNCDCARCWAEDGSAAPHRASFAMTTNRRNRRAIRSSTGHRRPGCRNRGGTADRTTGRRNHPVRAWPDCRECSVDARHHTWQGVHGVCRRRARCRNVEWRGNPAPSNWLDRCVPDRHTRNPCRARRSADRNRWLQAQSSSSECAKRMSHRVEGASLAIRHCFVNKAMASWLDTRQEIHRKFPGPAHRAPQRHLGT